MILVRRLAPWAILALLALVGWPAYEFSRQSHARAVAAVQGVDMRMGEIDYTILLAIGALIALAIIFVAIKLHFQQRARS